MKHLYRRIVVLSLSAASTLAQAQDVLPKGVGTYGIGYRKYFPQTKRYDAHGNKTSLGEPFSEQFTGKNLLDGAGGDDLQKLAVQLKKFDANSTSSDSLLNSLRLGQLDVDVDGAIDAQSFGFGYGITKHVTGFLMIPWVSARVDMTMNYVNRNNVEVIRQRLGDLAFEELKTGLNKASNISTQQILDSINQMGYQDISHWEYQGLGDITTGAMASSSVQIARRIALVHTWRGTLLIPTGHYDDPDILTDVSLGKGYYQIINQYAPSLVFDNQVKLGGAVSYGYGLPTQVQKRVPEENEGLVNADRSATVNLTPGADLGYSASVNYIPYWVQPGYTIGVSRHLIDTYDGTFEGNYQKLGEGSDSYELYHEFSLGLDTTTAFMRKQFPVPLLSSLTAHIPIEAKNNLDNRYFEFSISSFFSTPFASSDIKEELTVKSKKRMKRSEEYRTAQKRKAAKTAVAH